MLFSAIINQNTMSSCLVWLKKRLCLQWISVKETLIKLKQNFEVVGESAKGEGVMRRERNRERNRTAT